MCVARTKSVQRMKKPGGEMGREEELNNTLKVDCLPPPLPRGRRHPQVKEESIQHKTRTVPAH